MYVLICFVPDNEIKTLTFGAAQLEKAKKQALDLINMPGIKPEFVRLFDYDYDEWNGDLSVNEIYIKLKPVTYELE